MSSKKLITWELSILALSIVSTFIFHMLYDWTGENTLVGLIAPVNESVWEHGKLIFFPFLIYSLIELFVLKPDDTCNFLAIKFLAAILGTFSMSAFFYLYSGILGSHNLVLDIINGFVGVLLSFYVSYSYLKKNKILKHCMLINIIGLVIISLFFIFTYFPPNINWFIPSA